MNRTCRTVIHLSFIILAICFFTAPPVYADTDDTKSYDTEVLELFLTAIVAEDQDVRKKIATQGKSAAETDLNKNSEDISAHMILVSALGTIARASSTFESAREGYAATSKDHLDTLLVLAPEEPWVHALYGAWHLEVMRRSKVAGPLLLGAGTEDGLKYIEKALSLGENDPLLNFAVVLALLSSDEEKHAEKSKDILKSILNREDLKQNKKVFHEAQTLYNFLEDGKVNAAGELARNLM